MKCRHCKHSADAHLGECVALVTTYKTVEGQLIGKTMACGCLRCVPYEKREPTRGWVVQVSFFLRTGWTKPYEARVKAFGLVGAVAKGIREAKGASVKKRAHIKNLKVLMVAPIPAPRAPKTAPSLETTTV